MKVDAAIPKRAGIGLRTPHIRDVLDRRPDVGWLEVHAENYFGDSLANRDLEQARQSYPVSLHGVGLSPGSDQEIDPSHLQAFRDLIDRIDPGLVSEHMTWSSIDGIYLNDLMELPRSSESLAVISRNVDCIQDALGRRILMENPSSYLQYKESEIPEPEFIAEMCRRTGCGLLLDINNIYINSRNHDFKPWDYIMALPLDQVGEIHLAGHCVDTIEGRDVWIDGHGTPVSESVWDLYRRTLALTGATPTLIEWDSDLPDLATLIGEADKADTIIAAIGDNGSC